MQYPVYRLTQDVLVDGKPAKIIGRIGQFWNNKGGESLTYEVLPAGMPSLKGMTPLQIRQCRDITPDRLAAV